MRTSQGEYQTLSRPGADTSSSGRWVNLQTSACLKRPATHRIFTFFSENPAENVLSFMNMHICILLCCNHGCWLSALMGSSCQLNTWVEWWALFRGWVREPPQEERLGWLGGEGELCGYAWQRWRELWDSRAAGTWGSQRSSTDFYREAQNVSSPNIITENNNNHPLVWRTNWRAAHRFRPPVWSRCGDESR